MRPHLMAVSDGCQEYIDGAGNCAVSGLPASHGASAAFAHFEKVRHARSAEAEGMAEGF